MLDSDFDEFSDLLDGVSAMLSKGRYTPNAQSTALFFRSLERHSMDLVRAAFDAHIKDPKRGQYAPAPADILAHIEGMAANDGRPGTEEAWAMAMRASDESETVVWTEEMAMAWQVCQPVMAMGDEVGARMAFKESYARQVEDARKLMRPVSWSTSLGHDAKKRLSALTKAETLGLIGAGEALRLAPPEVGSDALTLLLESSVKRGPDVVDPDVIRERVAELKSKICPSGPDPMIAARQAAAIRERKAQINQAVHAYQSAGGSLPSIGGEA
jgi:hypothetical protein